MAAINAQCRDIRSERILGSEVARGSTSDTVLQGKLVDASQGVNELKRLLSGCQSRWQSMRFADAMSSELRDGQARIRCRAPQIYDTGVAVNNG